MRDFPQLDKGVDDGECRGCGSLAFEDGCQHIESALRESMGIDPGMFQFVEPVENFDQFMGLSFIQRQNLSVGKLLGIVF